MPYNSHHSEAEVIEMPETYKIKWKYTGPTEGEIECTTHELQYCTSEESVIKGALHQAKHRFENVTHLAGINGTLEVTNTQEVVDLWDSLEKLTFTDWSQS
jgi:hypothetical protein